MAAYNRRENKEKKLTTLQDEVSELKSDIGEIKNLLKSLLQGDNNAADVTETASQEEAA